MRTYFAAPVLMTGCAANVHPVTGSAPATDAVKPDGLLLLLRPALGSAFEQSPHRKPIATIHNLKLSGHTIRLLHLQRLANLGVGLSLSVSRHRTFFERPRGSCRGEVIFPLRNDVESFCSVSHNWCAGVVAVALRTTCAMTSATRKRSWFIHLRNPTSTILGHLASLTGHKPKTAAPYIFELHICCGQVRAAIYFAFVGEQGRIIVCRAIRLPLLR